MLRGETTVAQAARKHAITVAEIEQWRDRFLLGAENALRARPRDEEALREEEGIKRLQRKIGELTMDLDILKEANKLRPSMAGTSQSSSGVTRRIGAQGPSSVEFSPQRAAGAVWGAAYGSAG